MAKLTIRFLKTHKNPHQQKCKNLSKGENNSCLPVCGRLWAEGAAAAGAGLLGEFTGCDGVALVAGEAAAGVAGMSYFCSCSK